MSSEKGVGSQTQSDVTVVAETESKLDGAVGIGLVPLNATEEMTARALLRASSSGYSPLLVKTPAVDSAIVEFAQQLDIPVIEFLNQPDTSSEYHNVLAAAAQTAGAEQLIVHDELADPIDYDRTDQVRVQEEAFLITAVAESSSPPRPEVIAAIPAYNEADTIAEVIEKTTPHVDDVVVVDDGSSDATATVAHDAGATVIEHETNQGYGAALHSAFRMAAEQDTDRLIILDGDGQHEPADIPKLLAQLDETDSEIAIGSRLTEDGDTDIPLYRRFGLGVVNVLTNVSLGATNREQWIKDTQSGYRVYEQSAIQSIAADPSIGSGMDASTDILYHAQKRGYDIEEVGTTIYYDVEEGSNQHPVSHGVGLVVNILNMIERERPVALVGLPGFLLTIFGLTLGYFAFSNFLATNTFPIGLALASSMIFLTGLFLGLTATVLHALKQYLDNGNGSYNLENGIEFKHDYTNGSDD